MTANAARGAGAVDEAGGEAHPVEGADGSSQVRAVPGSGTGEGRAGKPEADPCQAAISPTAMRRHCHYLVVDQVAARSEVMSLKRAASLTGLSPRLIVTALDEDGIVEARGYIIAHFVEPVEQDSRSR